MLSKIPKNNSVFELMYLSETVPYIRLMDCMKKDINDLSKGIYSNDLSKGIYSLPDVLKEVKMLIVQKELCKNYIRSLEEKIYLDEEDSFSCNQDKEPYYVNRLKTLQCITNRLYDFAIGESYILGINSDTEGFSQVVMQNIDYDITSLLDNCEAMTLCFQVKKKQMINLVCEFGKTGYLATYKEGEAECQNSPIYRFSVFLTDDDKDEYTLIEEFEFTKEDRKNLYALTKTGCVFCRKNCRLKTKAKINLIPESKDEYGKYDFELYCKAEKGNKKCKATELDPWAILGTMAKVYDRAHKKNTFIRNPTDKKKKAESIGKIEISVDEEEYRIIPVTDNYVYDKNAVEYWGEFEHIGLGTHASPCMHVRRGTECTNKYGTTYYRKGCVVNAGKGPKAIYKL